MLQQLKAMTKSLCNVFLALLFGVVLVFYVSRPTHGAYLSQRSVVITTPQVNTNTSHDFKFNFISASAVGSIRFEYCTNSPLPGVACAAPAGLDVSAAVITVQTGETGFSLHPASTVNALIITRPSSVVVPQPARYLLSNIINPSAASITIFVRISTHVTTDASGPPTDIGSVAFSTSGYIGVGGFVPPFLTFCVGLTVQLDCSSITGQLVGFGELSTTQASTATSQFSTATNDPGGYSVYLSGQTMTAGNQVIPAMASTGASTPGTSQFGINLRLNTTPPIGANQTGGGTSLPAIGYGTSNAFRFVDGEQLVSSPLPTDYDKHTVSYIVNISPSQATGFYATTITYIAVVAF